MRNECLLLNIHWIDLQDREPVSKHLPLAWTRSSEAEEEKLIKTLDEFMQRFDN
jgi:hypothetical protein